MPHYANIHNAHTGNMLSSNQGILQGCGGCTGNGGGVIQARGIVGRKKGGKSRRRKHRNNSRKKGRGTKRHRHRQYRGGSAPSGSLTISQQQRNAHTGQQLLLTRGQLGGNGNGYGMTSTTASDAAHKGMGYGSTPMAPYNNCEISPPFKMGAGRAYSSIAAMQKGAGKNLTVNQSNNLSNAGYGYKGGDVKAFAGSYPPVSSTSYEQTCQQGGGTGSAMAAPKKKGAPKKGKMVSKTRKGAPSSSRAGVWNATPRTTTAPGALFAATRPPPIRSAAIAPGISRHSTPPPLVRPVTTGPTTTLAGRIAKEQGDVAVRLGNIATLQAREASGSHRGGSRMRRLVHTLATPFNAIAEAGHNAIRGVAQSSSLSSLTHPAQAGGRRRSRRNKRKGGRKSRRHRPRRRKRNTKHRRKRKKTRHRKRQRGGYAQYQSNLPLTSTLSLPAGDAGGTWTGQLATPPTYSRINDCHNNYNHFTGQNSPSPVLDGAAPQLPSLGGN